MTNLGKYTIGKVVRALNPYHPQNAPNMGISSVLVKIVGGPQICPYSKLNGRPGGLG